MASCFETPIAFCRDKVPFFEIHETIDWVQTREAVGKTNFEQITWLRCTWVTSRQSVASHENMSTRDKQYIRDVVKSSWV